MKKYCKVAVDNAFNDSILFYEEGTYSGSLFPGNLVTVPLGKRVINGCILETALSEEKFKSAFPLEKIKPIHEKINDQINLEEDLLSLFQWMSAYYHYGLGPLLFDSLPKFLKKPRELNFLMGKGIPLEINPNDDQENAILKIMPELYSGFSKWLIHGITGSGKTLIYLKLIQDILAKGKSALFILPEINLTPQFLQSFQTHLNVPIYSYNSGISQSDRFGLWKLLQGNDTPKIIIGVRSSVFLPIKNLGIIVVDEEHDQSLKQDDRCPYNSRDVAIKRASIHKIPVILGSATPSLESFYLFTQGSLKKNYIRLKKRANFSPLPIIKFIDMKAKEDETYWPFKRQSIDKIRTVLEKGEQVLIYVNRLGFARFLQCRSCGHKFSCPNCSLNLRYFQGKNEVSCNFCEYKEPAPQICPLCSNLKIHQKGFGTERLQLVLKEIFKDAIIERFDRDELSTPKKIDQRLSDFNQGKIDILIGTQMISKGHNFKNTNLVLVLGTDAQINFPDFRANEKVYQQLVQVSGRSGRFGQESEVLIHTFDSQNRVYTYLNNEINEDFFSDELSIREACLLPPYTKLALIYFTSKFKDKVEDNSLNAKMIMEGLISKAFNSVNVLGPRPSIIEKKVNRYTWVLMLKSKDINALHNLINSFSKNYNPHYSVTVKIDIDPYTID